MGKNLFSVPIFFIVFRETLEAAIIVSVLLGLVDQIVHEDKSSRATTLTPTVVEDAESNKDSNKEASPSEVGSSGSPIDDPIDDEAHRKRLVRRLRWQIFAGTGIGLLLAIAIGAAFIAVWFTKASDLWTKSEELWEGIFSLVASILIFIMGLGMLKLDRAKAKWRIKLEKEFDGKNTEKGAKTGKWALLILPMITVLREGMEAVVFVGGVSLGQPATSIPIAAIIGIICGLIIGYIIYAFASRSQLSIFLAVMTNFLFLIGAGLFSKAVGDLQENAFNHLLGAGVDDAGGDGPGSYRVQGNVWHLDCCNPDSTLDNEGWTIFGAVFGWTNSATLGSVLSYVFYWLAVIAVLIYMKFREGRTKLFGYESAAGRRRRINREEKAAASRDNINADEKREHEAEATTTTGGAADGDIAVLHR
ncbi:iron permease FTR1 [Cyathus striatus]|nr:iron permease FTR1 [Cyathus striatus]